MNPLFKMSNHHGQPNNNHGLQHTSIHSQGGSHHIGNSNLGGIGGHGLNQGIGGNAIGHANNNNAPPRSQ